jgi:spermidine/putrescine-binding protein
MKTPDYDPEMRYSVPYLWGTVGILYNTEMVEEPIDSWNVMFSEDYERNVIMMSSLRDTIAVALKNLGYSMNTDDLQQIDEAYRWLLEMNSTMEPAYVTDEVIDGMITGVKDIAVVYSGDAAIILQENEDMRFSMPQEGTNIWYDCMVIPANAENPLLAHEFINYMLSYEAAYDNAETVGYTSPNAEVLDVMTGSEDLFADNEAYLPRAGHETDESFRDNPVLKKTLSELWIKVKAAQ